MTSFDPVVHPDAEALERLEEPLIVRGAALQARGDVAAPDEGLEGGGDGERLPREIPDALRHDDGVTGLPGHELLRPDDERALSLVDGAPVGVGLGEEGQPLARPEVDDLHRAVLPHALLDP
jgi:hypothetical protein